MTDTTLHWTTKLSALDACEEAVEWAQQFDIPEAAWLACERGDWMLWLLGKLSDPPESNSRKCLVLTACECARLALPYVSAGEERPRIAIETAEAWARGKPSRMLKQVRAASDAYAAAWRKRTSGWLRRCASSSVSRMPFCPSCNYLTAQVGASQLSAYRSRSGTNW